LKVLFTHAFFLRLDAKQWRTAKPYPPLAPLYALAAVRQAGHTAELADLQFAHGGEELQAHLERVEPDVLVIYDDSFNYLTKMCLSVMEAEALRMVRLAKRRGLPVIVHGSDASDHRRRFLEEGADFVLLGDGEATLVELLGALERGEPWDRLQGLAFRRGGELVETGRRRSPTDLDSLAAPAWDAIDLAPYEHLWRGRHGRFSLNLVSSRGCPYGCNWCAKPVFGRQYYVHGPERVASDLQALKRRARFEHVWFCDDIFGLTPEWTGGFAEAVAARAVRTPFMCQTRADLMVKPELRRNLERAGLETTWLGVESGSQKVLDAMDKDLRVEETYEAVRRLQEEGVRVGLFLQYGYLGETRADIDATLRLVADLVPDEIGISVSYPLPGTGFHDRVSSLLGPKTNWRDSHDLELMYPGGHRPDYYRRLYRYTHTFFQTRRGLKQGRALLASPRRASGAQLKAALKTLFFGPASLLDRWRFERLEREPVASGTQPGQ